MVCYSHSFCFCQTQTCKPTWSLCTRHCLGESQNSKCCAHSLCSWDVCDWTARTDTKLPSPPSCTSSKENPGWTFLHHETSHANLGGWLLLIPLVREARCIGEILPLRVTLPMVSMLQASLSCFNQSEQLGPLC